MFNFRSKKKQQKLENEQKLGSPLVTYFEPMSAVAEQYKTIRTNIEFAQISSSVKSIAVTSSISMEGKSTTVVNLAYTYAQTGKKVLIVDSDLRKPTVHRTFKLNNELGLTTLLANPELKFNQVVQKSKELGLYFLPSGPMPPNPTELIGSTQMASLMQELSNNFDMVIYDTPPVNSVTDAQIIASRVDGVILVARQNFARKELVREAKQTLENVKANILGFVINNVPFEEGKGYGYYAYGLEEDEK
ncbi:CpsD/CapB family tyrosine-protein kinase [Carnobacterium sp. 1290_CSPC]|uniref:CpsD/CapB family tyrosine-protein kinase n=1 Tax=Carnobacterium sp. 1290_CSPC TaxID=1579347 RepID=UPI000660BC70|nr:CpsD/CapB family tyrosine-protein kinase [Carnobacterium sp. 1290_CSPC]